MATNGSCSMVTVVGRPVSGSDTWTRAGREARSCSSLAHLVEVLHGDRRRVAADVGFVPAQAREHPIVLEALGGDDLLQGRILGGDLAFEGPRGAGSALIDEDQVTRAADALESGDDGAERLCRRLAGPAGEKEESVRGRRPGE